MQSFESVLREEQPRINAVIQNEIAGMPELVQPVASHSLNAGGKRLRPMLTVFMGRLFGVTHPDLYTLAAAIEFFHVATLIHDDVLDNAPTRRGNPAAHAVYEPKHAILGGDAMLAHAARMVARIGNPRIVQQFAEGVVQTATGEIEEFMHLGNIALPHETYLKIITGKTAWSLRCSCEIPAIYAKCSEEKLRAAATFGLELGLAFQMVDDALDIAPSEHTGKPSGGDLRERKCTPLNQLYWLSLPQQEAEAFAECFAEGAFTDDEIAATIDAMRAKGLDTKVRDMAAVHLARAEEALVCLPGGAARDLLAQVPEFIRSRGN